jgi:hypothetical protein
LTENKGASAASLHASNPKALVGKRISVEGKGLGKVVSMVKSFGRATKHKVLFDDGLEQTLLLEREGKRGGVHFQVLEQLDTDNSMLIISEVDEVVLYCLEHSIAYPNPQQVENAMRRCYGLPVKHAPPPMPPMPTEAWGAVKAFCECRELHNALSVLRPEEEDFATKIERLLECCSIGVADQRRYIQMLEVSGHTDEKAWISLTQMNVGELKLQFRMKDSHAKRFASEVVGEQRRLESRP